MSSSNKPPTLTVREQRAKQLKHSSQRADANKNTETKKIYDRRLKEQREEERIEQKKWLKKEREE